MARPLARFGGIAVLVAALVSGAVPAAATAAQANASGHGCCTGADDCSVPSATITCCKPSQSVPPSAATSLDRQSTNPDKVGGVGLVPPSPGRPCDALIRTIALARLKSPPHPAYLLNSVFLI